jgi:hypothetical protein
MKVRKTGATRQSLDIRKCSESAGYLGDGITTLNPDNHLPVGHQVCLGMR